MKVRFANQNSDIVSTLSCDDEVRMHDGIALAILLRLSLKLQPKWSLSSVKVNMEYRL